MKCDKRNNKICHILHPKKYNLKKQLEIKILDVIYFQSQS